MKLRWNWALAALACLMLVACSNANNLDTNGVKPDRDPDEGLVDNGKTDTLSNWYTTIVANIDVPGKYAGAISYPDWFHGVTLTLKAGDEVTISASTSAEGYFRVYGPSYRTLFGRPLFKKPVFQTLTSDAGNGDFTASTTLKVKESGLYLLVYGPRYVWNAKYAVKVEPVPLGCGSDADCKDGEFCQQVYCITTPCPALCQPKGGVNAFCTGPNMCQSGLACINNHCTQLPFGGCESDDDCSDGFCGYTEDGSRTCKPYQKEGESCGGFVPAHLYKQCAPELTCAAPPFIADGPGVCSLKVSVAELLKDPKAYHGHVVTLTGDIKAGLAFCTLMACSPQNACCNSCGGNQIIVDEGSDAQDGVRLRDENGKEYSCGGNNCTYQDNCTVKNGKYFVIGTFTTLTEYEHYLDVTSIHAYFE
ncbi:MAG: hypothetical protein KC609_10630 [Myxococcales bacterium]|nr:hypothetical protein [Myxococcales bacterium]